MNKIRFSFPRLGMLLRNDLQIFSRLVLYASLVLLGLMIALYMVQVQDVIEHGTAPPFFTEWFGTILMIGGFLLSSFAFYELANKQKGMSYLMVPASMLEKWLSRLLLTGPAFALYFWILFGVIALIAQGISQLLFGVQLEPFEWSGDTTWLLIRLYLVFQAFFVAGSVFLGRLAFLKTPVALAIVGFVMLGIMYLYLKALTWNISQPGWEIEFAGEYRNSAGMRAWVEGPMVKTLEGLFWWVLAPFFWVVSYLRLTEKEV